jgi:hypothetical protein
MLGAEACSWPAFPACSARAAELAAAAAAAARCGAGRLEHCLALSLPASSQRAAPQAPHRCYPTSLFPTSPPIPHWQRSHLLLLHAPAALAAYRDWRAGKPEGLHVTKAAKLGWVAGLAPEPAAVLEGLPFTLALRAYNVLVVHAGLVPGRPPEEQQMGDMLKVGAGCLGGLVMPPPTHTRWCLGMAE